MKRNESQSGLPPNFNLKARLAEDDKVNERRLVYKDGALIELPHAAAAAQRIFNFQEEMRKTLEQSETREVKSTEEAHRDPLTGLANRRLLGETYDKLQQAVLSTRTAGHESTIEAHVVVLDLDNFKSVNDSGGHEAGDKVLLRVAEVIQKNIRERDIAARVGGDEFVLLLPGITAERVQDAVEAINEDVGDLTPITTSIGVGVIDFGQTLEENVARVDAALYAAKASGKDIIVNVDQLGESA